MNGKGMSEPIYFSSKAEWRQWLLENHQEPDSIWFLFYKQRTKKPTLTWEEAVEEALCFGWIDGRKKTLDDESYIQLFSRRKANSTWSRKNKDTIERLIHSGKMTAAGLTAVHRAKQNGSWIQLDEVDNLQIPAALESAFIKNKAANDFYHSLSNSNKKLILQWVILAKRDTTKATRIAKIIESCREGKLPFS
jgi:uncharacterized protein YdeI (YjbR/CyaY-like superfamily)